MTRSFRWWRYLLVWYFTIRSQKNDTCLTSVKSIVRNRSNRQFNDCFLQWNIACWEHICQRYAFTFDEMCTRQYEFNIEQEMNESMYEYAIDMSCLYLQSTLVNRLGHVPKRSRWKHVWWTSRMKNNVRLWLSYWRFRYFTVECCK
jgi:hypothetical protein